MEMRDDFVSRTIKTEKLFNLDPGHCYYANIEVTKKNQKSDQDSKIKITNNICKQNNNHLIKITEVKFGNRVIYIQDSYFFRLHHIKDNQINGKSESPPTTSSDGSQNNNSVHNNDISKSQFMLRKKKLIFKKKNIGQNYNHKQQRRNTKNVAKNFCKAFLSYLQQKNQSIVIGKMKQLIESYKFNNKIIEKIAKDPKIKQNFKTFLKEKAEDWINSSKIHDKQTHIEAIGIYLNLIQKGDDSFECLYDSQQKSIYHSDQNYQGSEQCNSREVNKKK